MFGTWSFWTCTNGVFVALLTGFVALLTGNTIPDLVGDMRLVLCFCCDICFECFNVSRIDFLYWEINLLTFAAKFKSMLRVDFLLNIAHACIVSPANNRNLVLHIGILLDNRY